MDQLSTKILMIFAAIKDFFTFFINTIILKTKNVLFKIFKKFNLAPLCPPPIPSTREGERVNQGTCLPGLQFTKPYYHSFLSYGFLIKKVPVIDGKVVNLVTLQPGFQNLCLLGYLLILGDFKTVLANCRDLWFHPLNLCCPRP